MRRVRADFSIPIHLSNFLRVFLKTIFCRKLNFFPTMMAAKEAPK
jgi:hypothetical protein